jgi:hypothetical protein
MVGRLGLIIVGFGLLFYAWQLYTVPLPLGAPERTAPMYQYLGQEGQAAVAAGAGLLFLILGVILVRNVIVSVRQQRARLAQRNAAPSRRP